MGGFDVVALQGICASYFDKHVVPMLQSMQQAQERFDKQLEDLSARVEKTAVQEDKAVPSIERFEQLVAEVEEKAKLSAVDDLIAKIELKADASELNGLLERVESAVTAERVVHVEESTQLQERVATVERKVDTDVVRKLEQVKKLSLALDAKANVMDVPSLAQFQKLSQTVERKAFSNRVPTVTQFQELAAAVEGTVKAEWVPTISQFEELEKMVKKQANADGTVSAKELNERLSKELQRKANTDEVATQAQIQELSAEVLENGRSVAEAKVAELADAMEQKMNWLATKVKQSSESIEYLKGNLCWTYVTPYADGSWDMQPVGNNQQAAPKRQRGNRRQNGATNGASRVQACDFGNNGAPPQGHQEQACVAQQAQIQPQACVDPLMSLQALPQQICLVVGQSS
mmetsp:Transcript_115155/g.209512  ORF Transcript_115155/g.209512 Transcript_115155/m.209512 type:complete len:404 (+) Transcript_115155:38-1249(+)